MIPTSTALNAVIGAAFADAIAYHSDLGLSDAAWTQRIVAILGNCKKSPADPASAGFAERLHSRDLYLATCCAAGLDSGWRRFESLYQRYVEELVRYLACSTLQALEVGEGLLFDLFLPD